MGERDDFWKTPKSGSVFEAHPKSSGLPAEAIQPACAAGTDGYSEQLFAEGLQLYSPPTTRTARLVNQVWHTYERTTKAKFWGYTPCPWCGGYPVDTGARLPAEQPSQSCSRLQPQANSSGCWFSQHSGPAEGWADRVAQRWRNASTMQLPNVLPCLGAAALRSQFQGVLKKWMWNKLFKDFSLILN